VGALAPPWWGYLTMLAEVLVSQSVSQLNLRRPGGGI
jgi:hypothetical protein